MCGSMIVYPWVPVDLWVFDPWLWVICGKIFMDLGMSLGPKIPTGMDPGHPWIHSCPGLGTE